MTLVDGAILLAASTVAGAINSIAGGGSLITLPTETSVRLEKLGRAAREGSAYGPPASSA